MADPICRWRNTTPETVRLLVSLLPKVEMPEADFKQEVKNNCDSKKFDYDKFFTTAYQLAVQIGLYYVDSNGMYHPRFNHDLNDAEAAEYVSRVATLYVSPNPYAKSMEHAKSVACLYDLFVQRAGSLHKGASIDVKKELEDYYHLPIGNTDMVVNLMVSSGAFDKIDGQHITYKGFDNVAKDKELFFKHFGSLLGQAGNSCGRQITENVLLRVGDTFSGKDDGTFTVIEVLPRIYRIRANKSGKIRSVPKAVVAAWHDFYKNHPVVDYDEKKKDGTIIHKTNIPIADAGTRHVRDQYLRSLTEDDPYEHGYDGMLGSVARWLIDQKREAEATSYIISSGEGVAAPAVATLGDRLSVALKMFAEKRKEEEWCSDNTDGDATKPRAGYVANKQLRVLSNTSADIDKLNGDGASKIKAWFKNYWNVADGKSWLEGLSDADLSGFGPYIAHLLQPGSPAVAKPAKFSNALEAAVKAVIKPEETGLYDERVNETLKFLGLIGFDWNENFDADDLGEAVNAQRVIKRRLKDMGLKRIQESPTADDGNAPDYLTVNEFLWFVKLNLNRIEKEVQEGKMKPATHKDIDASQKSRKPKVNIKDSEDVLLLRLRAALRTKPFAILAGHSGTGKSRMVRKLAYMTCNDKALRYVLDDAGDIKKDEHGNDIFLKEPGNFCMVQVKPNWHDSSDLLGYYSELGKRYRSTDFVEFICKAYAYPDTPFFVCLDEMNLAPVEQYFAEYLSAIESRKLTKVTSESDDPPTDEEGKGVLTTDELIAKSAYTKEDATGKSVMYEWLGCTMTESQQWLETYGLTIPRNLFVVGTVNMDETTNQFSRKVLDRAMTIEMTDADFDSFGAKSPELKFDDEYMGDAAVKEMLTGEVQANTLTGLQKNNLNALKAVLAPTSFAVAYRFANEYALYEESLKKTVGSSVKPNPPGTPEGTPEEVLTLPEPASAAAPAVPEVASPEAAESVSAAEAAPAAEEGTAEGAAPAPAKKDPAIPSAFDDMVLMKVLPRISGDEADVKQIFYEGRVVGKKGTRENPADKTLMKILDVSKDTESLRKIAAILDRGGTYLSFWP